MASVIERPNGHKWVQFSTPPPDKKRHTLYLGKTSVGAAREVAHHVEQILSSRVSGEPLARSTARWLGESSPAMRKKFAKCGLVAHTAKTETLGGLLEYCLGEYEDKKPNTRRNMTRAANALKDRFGKSCPLESITRGDAEDFRRWLRRDGLAETTVSEICRKSKRFFTMACDHCWIDVNPFSGMKGWTRTNKDRQAFIDRETIDRLMKRCEPEWQLIIALVRFGGLRCPSEVLSLRWDWIDFAKGRFSVFSCKTEHINGKAFRDVPIFPELRAHLESAWDRAEPGAEYVVERSRECSDRAIDSAMRKRLVRAGINPWPKLFTNLRSSRETELVEEFPIHVVVAWLGNSIDIAKAHYLQVTDEHFRRASSMPAQSKKQSKVSRKSI